MSKDSYFVLRSSEDGIHIDGPLTWQVLSERLKPLPGEKSGYYGNAGGFEFFTRVLMDDGTSEHVHHKQISAVQP